MLKSQPETITSVLLTGVVRSKIWHDGTRGAISVPGRRFSKGTERLASAVWLLVALCIHFSTSCTYTRLFACEWMNSYELALSPLTSSLSPANVPLAASSSSPFPFDHSLEHALSRACSFEHFSNPRSPQTFVLSKSITGRQLRNTRTYSVSLYMYTKQKL